MKILLAILIMVPLVIVAAFGCFFALVGLDRFENGCRWLYDKMMP